MELFYSYREVEPYPCPACSEPMWSHGFYWRKLKIPEGGAVRLPVSRYRCVNCRRTHAILPDFVAPYRHYPMLAVAKVIEEVVEAEVPVSRATGGQDISTTSRWAKRFLGIVEQVLGSLGNRAYTLKEDKALIFGEKEEPGVWGRLRSAPGRLPAIKSTSILGAVNIFLTWEPAGIYV
ncbi:MAG: DUF6431 domain-containing protein [Moorellaceae bacterium]